MEHVSVCGVWRGDTVCVVCGGGTLCVWSVEGGHCECV